MSWLKQAEEPLFSDLLWSRPENKNQAGKLLIIGGSRSEFMNVSSAYSFAKEAGAGHVKVLLPESLRKIAGNIDGSEFAAANQSGSFARNALASFFDLSDWADHVLLAGDFGKNSETTIILDGYLLKNPKPITISENSLGSIGIDLAQLINLPGTIVINREIFRKIGIVIGAHVPITSLATYETFGKIIQDISRKYKANLVIQNEEHIWCGVNGNIVSTKTKPVGSSALAAYCSVWLTQNPNKPLEALATAVFSSIQV